MKLCEKLRNQRSFRRLTLNLVSRVHLNAHLSRVRVKQRCLDVKLPYHPPLPPPPKWVFCACSRCPSTVAPGHLPPCLHCRAPFNPLGSSEGKLDANNNTITALAAAGIGDDVDGCLTGTTRGRTERKKNDPTRTLVAHAACRRLTAPNVSIFLVVLSGPQRG